MKEMLQNGFLLQVGLLMIVAAPAFLALGSDPIPFETEVDTILRHDDGEFIWFHPRATRIGDTNNAILTLQKHLGPSDYYSALQYMWSEDLGQTWEGPIEPPELAWGSEPGDIIVGVCDVTPMWHSQSGRVIAVGVKVRYKDGNQLLDQPQSHAAGYAAFNPETREWTPWKFIEMPEADGKFFLTTPGCTQWLVQEDGSILLPVYFREKDKTANNTTVLKCSFDGKELKYESHGDELELDQVRGLVEPSLTQFGDDFFLTIRNDERGYVTKGKGGLKWDPIRPWTFDDGEELGSYNTQQHWVTYEDGLFLVYTRRGAENDHIMRNRAPLFIAQVDPENLQVIRSTERVLIPQRGAQLGNFGANRISDNEWWVTVSEGLWGKARELGAEGATFAARIRFLP